MDTGATTHPLRKPAGDHLSAVERLADAGDHEGAAALLRACAPADRDENGWTPLHWAAALGLDELVDELLPSSDAHARAKDGQTALMFAAEFGHAGCVSALLPASDAWNHCCAEGSAIDRAAREGHLDCVELLCEPSIPDPKDQRASSLARAAALAGGLGRIESLRLLMGRGAFESAPERWFDIAVVEAAMHGSVECLRELLARGRPSEGEAANAILAAVRELHPAARGGAIHERIFECVLELLAIVEPGKAQEQAHRALEWAAAFGHERAVAALLPHCHPGLLATPQCCALAVAASEGHAGAVELLLRHGASPESRWEQGRTALMLAAEKGRSECLRALLPVSDLTALDDDGRDALGAALAAGHEEAANMVRGEIARREGAAIAEGLPGARSSRPASRL